MWFLLLQKIRSVANTSFTHFDQKDDLYKLTQHLWILKCKCKTPEVKIFLACKLITTSPPHDCDYNTLQYQLISLEDGKLCCLYYGSSRKIMFKSLYWIGIKYQQQKTATFWLEGLRQVVWKEKVFTYLFEKNYFKCVFIAEDISYCSKENALLN